MSNHRDARRLRVACGAALALGVVLPASALATPTGLVNCHGSLAKATATADDANPLSYAFTCDGAIQSYTIVANRQVNDVSTLDDFSPTVSVLDSTQTVPSSTQSVSCSAVLPGNGINCFAVGSSSKTLAIVSAGQYIESSFDTTDPYCGAAAQTIKVKGKKGKTRTKVIPAEPRAVVQLVVTDKTGAEFGPFSLNLKPRCPTVHKGKSKKKTVVKVKHA